MSAPGGDRRRYYGRGRVEDAVKMALHHFGERGATIGEILEFLTEQGIRTTYNSIREVIRRLMDRGLVIPGGKRGRARRPETVYILLKRPIPECVEICDRIEEKSLRDEVISECEMLERLEKSREYFKECAKKLRGEDPRKLIKKMIEWLYDEYVNTLTRYYELRGRAPPGIVDKLKQRLRNLEKLADRFVHGCLGIPRYNDKDRKEIIFHLHEGLMRHIKEDPTKRYMNCKVIEEIIDSSVSGEAVIEKVRADPHGRAGAAYSLYTSLVVEAGSDVSLGKIRPIGDIIPSTTLLFYDPQLYVPFYLIPAAVAWARFLGDGETGLRIEIRVEPDPKTWLEYEKSRALEEGLIILPSQLLDVPEPLRDRLIEAAMDLRQYVCDLRLRSQPMPGDEVSPFIIFRDGRIYPYEHRFSDFIQRTEHGRMVRRCIRAFEIIMDACCNDSILYCGVVKTPRKDFFAPLVFWYMKYGSKMLYSEAIWEDEVVDEYLFEKAISDQLIAYLLFSELEPPEDGFYWVTFRIFRPFYAMLEDYIAFRYRRRDHNEWLADFISILLDREIEWEEESLREMIVPEKLDVIDHLLDLRKKLRRGEIDIHQFVAKIADFRDAFRPGVFEWILNLIEEFRNKLRPFARVCALARVAVFYAGIPSPPSGVLLYRIPRLEIMIPYWLVTGETTSPEFIDKKVREYVEVVLYALQPRMLDLYKERKDVEMPIVLPKVIIYAHETAQDVARYYREVIIGLIIKYLSEEYTKRRRI